MDSPVGEWRTVGKRERKAGRSRSKAKLKKFPYSTSDSLKSLEAEYRSHSEEVKRALEENTDAYDGLERDCDGDALCSEAPVIRAQVEWKDVSAACRACVEDVLSRSDAFCEAFRIEVVPPSERLWEEGLWRVEARVDPVAWYDHCLKHRFSEEEATSIARAYVERGRDLERRLGACKSKPIADEPIATKEYCINQGVCSHGDGCNWAHSKFVCEQPMKRRDGQFSVCNYCSIDELLLEDFVTEEFIAHARVDGVSEFLVLPNPRNPTWKKHLNNIQLVSLPHFWSYLREVVFAKLDPVLPSKIALNFGSWETVLAKDRQAADCHGHAHIWLLRDDLELLLEEYPDRFAPVMTGRLRLPVDYVTVNCDNLETKRLLAAETRLVATDTRRTRESLEQLQETVEALGGLLQQVLDRLPAKQTVE